MPSPLKGLRPLLRAVATTVVPEASELDESGWVELEGIIEGSLEERPPALQRRVRIFLRVIQWSALMRYGRFFTSLDPRRRARHLEYFQDHSKSVIRLGFWGLRTMVFMGYYGHTAVGDDIGYRPDPQGWSARK